MCFEKDFKKENKRTKTWRMLNERNKNSILLTTQALNNLVWLIWRLRLPFFDFVNFARRFYESSEKKEKGVRNAGSSIFKTGLLRAQIHA